MTGPKQPVLGFDTAGQVEAVGSAVTRFRPGDRVLASRGFDFGCHADRVVVGEQGAIAPIPDGLTSQDAVALSFGGTTARYFFERGRLAAGESVLINGASGAVGTMAVQLAKHLGAEVTGVCSGANAELVASLGADHVIDHTAEDFTRNGRRYDVIMDNHGNAPYSRVKGSLAPGGRFLMVVGDLWQMIAASRQKAVIGGTPPDACDLGRELSGAAGTGRGRRAAAGDRLGAAVRPDRRCPPPGRHRPQGRQPGADVRRRGLAQA